MDASDNAGLPLSIPTIPTAVELWPGGPKVTAADLLPYADPRCRHCTRGLIAGTAINDSGVPVRYSQVCGCAATRYSKEYKIRHAAELRAAAAAPGDAAVAQLPDRLDVDGRDYASRVVRLRSQQVRAKRQIASIEERIDRNCLPFVEKVEALVQARDHVPQEEQDRLDAISGFEREIARLEKTIVRSQAATTAMVNEREAQIAEIRVQIATAIGLGDDHVAGMRAASRDFQQDIARKQAEAPMVIARKKDLAKQVVRAEEDLSRFRQRDRAELREARKDYERATTRLVRLGLAEEVPADFVEVPEGQAEKVAGAEASS